MSKFGEVVFGEGLFGEGVVPPPEETFDPNPIDGPDPTWTLPIAGPREEEPTAPPWLIYSTVRLSHVPQRRFMQLRNRKFTFDLYEGDRFTFDIDGEAQEAQLIDEMITDMMAFRNGVLMYRGRVIGSGDDIDESRHSVSFSTVDYKQLLFRREIHTTVDTMASALEQSDIAWEFVTQVQSATGGDLGITRGTGQVTGVSRGDLWEPGGMAGAYIDDMASREHGFDWSVDAYLRFNIHYPVRGQATHFYARYGGSVTKVTRNVDPSDFANAIRAVGTAEDGTPIQSIATHADLATLPEGRWDRTEGGTNAKNSTELSRAAQGLLATYGAIVPSYTLTLRHGVWDPRIAMPGDTIQLEIRKGRLNVNTYVRIYRVEVALDESGDESVTLTVGAPSMSLASRLWRYGRRLDELERR